MKTKILTINQYLLSRLDIIVYFLSYIVPIAITHPQWITGTIVNCFLYISAEKLNKKEYYPILILPSLGAITRGLLFGPQTIFLYYFLPFIWLGNYLLVFVFSTTKNSNYLLRISLASFLKYLLLITTASLYFKLKIVPQIFVTSMGIMQLITAFTGGLLAIIIIQILNKNYERT